MLDSVIAQSRIFIISLTKEEIKEEEYKIMRECLNGIYYDIINGSKNLQSEHYLIIQSLLTKGYLCSGIPYDFLSNTNANLITLKVTELGKEIYRLH